MKALWIICGVVVAGAAIGMLNHRLGSANSSRPTGFASTDPSNSPVVWAGPRRADGGTTAGDPALNLPMEEAPAVSNASTNWEDEIGELLTASDMSETEIGHRLLELFPNLPEEGQEQVALHLSFLLPDEDYSLLLPYLTNPLLPASVIEALFTGVLMRDSAVQAPLLLAIATDTTHPKAEEARSNLEALIGRELGDDPGEWANLVQRFLRSTTPEENSNP